MPVSKLQLLQDRAMRDAARQVVTTDLALMRAGLAQNGVGNQTVETARDYLNLLGIGAADLASENRGKLAGGLALAVAGAAAWLFRYEIGEVLAGFFGSEEAEDLSGEWDETGDETGEPETPDNIGGVYSHNIAEHD